MASPRGGRGEENEGLRACRSPEETVRPYGIFRQYPTFPARASATAGILVIQRLTQSTVSPSFGFSSLSSPNSSGELITVVQALGMLVFQ